MILRVFASRFLTRPGRPPVCAERRSFPPFFFYFFSRSSSPDYYLPIYTYLKRELFEIIILILFIRRDKLYTVGVGVTENTRTMYGLLRCDCATEINLLRTNGLRAKIRFIYIF